MSDRGRGSDARSRDADESSGLAPDEAFSLLGDATRLEIVTALHDGPTDSPTPFSALYDQVDADDTGRFNYHLDQLVPHFVSRSDDGYELTAAGDRIARAVAAGTYTDTPRLPPFEMDGDCYACGAAALEGAYEEETFSIECRACSESVLDVPAPPSLVRGREPDAFVAVFDRWSRAQVDQANRGFCPDCGGAVDPGVTVPTGESIPFDAVAEFTCTVCGRRPVTSFGSLALRHPVVETFHRRRGTAVPELPYWEIPQCCSGDHVAVVSPDPWRIRVSFYADGDACHVEFGDDVEVVKTEIVHGETPADD